MNHHIRKTIQVNPTRNNGMVIRYGGGKLTLNNGAEIIHDGGELSLNERECEYLLALMLEMKSDQHMVDVEELKIGDIACGACKNLGYLEVETDEGMEIQNCESCDYFGTVWHRGAESPQDKAQNLAKLEGILGE